MASVEQVAAVGQILVDPKLDLTQRFRALFTLKNLGGKTSIYPYFSFDGVYVAFKKYVIVEVPLLKEKVRWSDRRNIKYVLSI